MIGALIQLLVLALILGVIWWVLHLVGASQASPSAEVATLLPLPAPLPLVIQVIIVVIFVIAIIDLLLSFSGGGVLFTRPMIR